MADLLNYNASQILGFLLILVRVAAVITTAPIFSNAQIPAPIKISIAVVFTLVLYPVLPRMELPLDSLLSYLLWVGSELIVGFSMGYVGQVLFAVVEFAGEMAGFQMGLSMATTIDPQWKSQRSIIGQFHLALATLLFLVMDAHHVVIEALVHSYEWIPPGTLSMNAPLVKWMIQLTSGVIVLGCQLGAPVIVALFLANLIMGVVARSVPQLNIFVIGFPITLLLGFFLLGIGVPVFMQTLRILFESYDDQVVVLIQLLKAP